MRTDCTPGADSSRDRRRADGTRVDERASERCRLPGSRRCRRWRRRRRARRRGAPVLGEPERRRIGEDTGYLLGRGSRRTEQTGDRGEAGRHRAETARHHAQPAGHRRVPQARMLVLCSHASALDLTPYVCFKLIYARILV